MADVVTKFKLTGGFDIVDTAQPVAAVSGETCAYKMEDGSTIRLVVALEVESSDGNTFTYITAEKDMADAGFCALEYNDIMFS